MKAVCAKHNLSEATFYAWKRKDGGMDVNEARGRLRGLEDENVRLKRLVADLSVQNQIIKEVNEKMASPSAKRRAVKLSVEEGLGSSAVACPTLGLARSSFAF